MNQSRLARDVFCVSDRTGKTARAMAESLLSQFPEQTFRYHDCAFVTTGNSADAVARRIIQAAQDSGLQPIVISTLVNRQSEQSIAETGACVISLFHQFITPLEQSLNTGASEAMGMPHEQYTDSTYHQHIDAIEFALNFDDGHRNHNYGQAEVILIGVSRCAKTPTCLYLAMNFSIRTANYPLTEDDLDAESLPEFLLRYRERLVGLTIQPRQLSAIREKRRPRSHYASLAQCEKEVRQAEQLMREHQLTLIDSSAMSIEEIAIRIVRERKLLQNPGQRVSA